MPPPKKVGKGFFDYRRNASPETGIHPRPGKEHFSKILGKKAQKSKSCSYLSPEICNENSGNSLDPCHSGTRVQIPLSPVFSVNGTVSTVPPRVPIAEMGKRSLGALIT
jgi:hypothetical protein